MKRADSNLWNTANYSIKLRIAYDHPPTLYFFQHAVTAWPRPVPTLYTRGSDPVAACCRSERFFLFSAIAPTTRCPSEDIFSFQPCVDARLRPVQTLLLDYFGPNRLLSKQQNSSQLVPKHFLYIFFHIWSCCSVLAPVSRLPSRSPNGFDRSSDSF